MMKMKLKRVVLNKSAISNLPRDPGVQRDVHRRADRVLDRAESIAPVLSGRYRDNLHTEEGPDGSVKVVSDLEYSMSVEANDGVLAKSIDAAGGD